MHDEMTKDKLAKAARVIDALKIAGKDHGAFRKASAYVVAKSGEVRVYTNEGRKGNYLEICEDGTVRRTRPNYTWGQLIDVAALSAL